MSKQFINKIAISVCGMKRFFNVLLVVGIVLTVSSAFLLNSNGIYAIFMATLGVMITVFSVFEIVGFKKHIGPIANKRATSKAKKSAESSIEWSYYDVGEEKRSRPLQGQNEEPKLKYTFWSKLLSMFKLKKHLKIKGEQIEKETKKETKKLRNKDKVERLKEYIEESLKKNVPRESIIEACLASEWPREKIDEVLSGFAKKKTSKHVKILYLLIPAAIILLFWLFLTENFLIGYWLETIKDASNEAYYAVLLVILVIFASVIFDFKEQMAKKRKVYKIKKEQRVSDIKTEIATKKIVFDAGSSFKTDIDKLLDLVNEKEKISVDEVGGIFGISKEEAEQWGKILKDQDLITLYYPTVGDAELRCKKREMTEEEEL